MNHLDLILTLTGGLAAALTLGLISQKLGLSPIVGYLLAGILVGPSTPGFAANKDLAKEMAEVGVILLMFGVGLHFHFKELLAVKRIAIPGAVVQSTVATVLSMIIMHYGFGWSWEKGAVFGMAIAVASTVVLTRVLVDNKHLHTPIGHIAIGWLVVEDLFTVFILVLIPAIAGVGEAGGAGGIGIAMGWTLVKIVALVAFTFIFGGWAIPRMLTMIARTGSRELFTLGVLVIALGIAVGATKLFGVSMELGAFLAGMVVARSEFSTRAATDALPMKDAFGVLFFVSVGMLFDIRTFVDSPWLAAVTVAIIVIAKPASAIAIALLLRYPLKTALAVGAVLSQIGEFSFLVGTIAMQHNLLDEEAFNVLVASAIITITVVPMLYRGVTPLERWAARQPALQRFVHPAAVETKTGEVIPDSTRHAVIVGYGPVGKTVTRLLGENEFTPCVIEMNVDTVNQLRAEGIAAVYGDASHPDTLRAAGVDKADIFILSSSSIEAGTSVIREAKALNPKLRIVARTAYLSEARTLIDKGADAALSGEGEVALSMTENILSYFGATDEQLDRERDRIRRELFGKAAS
jgi:CPA2 family monovalent cation:H+ antiporter-2